MSKLKSEVSKKNPYYISKNRYYELKYYCLQYPVWKQAYNALLGLASRPFDMEIVRSSGIDNPTERVALSRDRFLEDMKKVEQAAINTDPDLYNYILMAVTQGYSYETLQTVYEIPCCRESYYKMYRRFFWELSKIR